MSKADKYIEENTRNCSNAIQCYDGDCNPCTIHNPWLSPDQARKAVEIAKEEMLNDICEWIEENIGEYCDGENIMFSAIHIENIDIFGQERFINDLKQAMKDE
jgi:uncharacterized Fe-S cluster protein YjdI